MGVTLCSAFLLYRMNSSAKAITVGVPTQTGSGLPIRLSIPRIAVDAVIEQVGLTSTGAMDVPKGPDGVAWLSIGPQPGKEGSAVIAGHWGWKGGRAAVFDRLNTLRKGDIVLVTDDQGAVRSFVVRETRIFAATADATEVFTSTNGSHLNLVTCDGDWNAITESYSTRLVVFTDLVP